MLMEIIVDKVWILAWHACCSLSSVKQTHLFKTSRFVCNYLQIYTDSKCGKYFKASTNKKILQL